VAAGQGAQREHGRRQWAGDRAGDQGGRGCHQVAAGRSRSCSRSSAGAVTTSALRALLAWGGPGSRSVGRPAAPRSSPPARFRPWGHGGLAGLDRAGGSLGIGRVGLAAAAAGLAVGSVDLHTTWPPVARKRARAAPEEPVPSTPQRWLAEPAGPGEPVLIAGGGGGDAAGADAAAELVAGVGEVAVQVGVDPTVIGWAAVAWAMLVMAASLSVVGWTAPTGRPGGQHCDGSGRQASDLLNAGQDAGVCSP
jgi:hypothetical protein